jgi:hypothetical protein
MATGTQAMAGAGASAAIGISLLNLSSPMAIWSMANQFQLFMLLLLTKTHLPADVRGYITNNKLMSFSLDFLPIKKLFVVKVPTEWMNFDQSIDELEEIGIMSGSSFNNNVGFIFIFVLIVLTHF